MINYNYLSCTDYDGTTKELNVLSKADTLPSTASEDYSLLVVRKDTANENLLHIQEAPEEFLTVAKAEVAYS